MKLKSYDKRFATCIVYAILCLCLLPIGRSRDVKADGNLLILGDSRAEGMHACVGDAGVDWCYKIGAGYNWMVNQGLPTIDGRIGQGTSVVISLGVNDVIDAFRISQYAAVINEKATIWKQRSATTFYASITPVDDNLDQYEHNSDILYWNNTIRTMLSPDVIYMDLYSPVIQGFSTTDGLHYTDATYRDIFQLITQFVGAYAYRGSDGMHMTAADTEGAGAADEAAAQNGSDLPESEVSDLRSESLAELPEFAGGGETFPVLSVLDQAASDAYSGWLALNDGTYYMLDGEITSGWIGIDHDFYYFDEAGRMLTGSQTLAEGSYVFDENGMLTHVLEGKVPVLESSFTG